MSIQVQQILQFDYYSQRIKSIAFTINLLT